MKDPCQPPRPIEQTCFRTLLKPATAKRWEISDRLRSDRHLKGSHSNSLSLISECSTHSGYQALVHRNILIRVESYRRIDPSFVDRPMDKALAYAISALIAGFGVWIFVAGMGSNSPALWTVVALVPIAIGLISAFGPY